MATTTTTPAPTTTTAKSRPINQAYEAHVAKRAAFVARRRPPVIPRTLEDGAVVEVKGRAKVEHTENGATTKSDHQGACGVVIASYPSEQRGERLASVKCEDGQLRAIPESRLRKIGAVTQVGGAPVAPEAPATPAAAPARGHGGGGGGRVTIGGGDDSYRQNWERLFGNSSKARV